VENLIIEHINDFAELEKLYRLNPNQFAVAFDAVYASNPGIPALQVWHERLHYSGREQDTCQDKFDIKELLTVILLAVTAGTIANLVNFVDVGTEIKRIFYERNTGFFVFPFIAAYFIIRNKPGKFIVRSVVWPMFCLLIYMNCLPDLVKSQSLMLVFIHVPIILWFLTGVAFLGKDTLNPDARINYLKFYATVLVYMALFAAGGMILVGTTIGLFEAIGIRIEQYMDKVMIYCVIGAVMVAAYFSQVKNQLSEKFVPTLANIFSPLVFIMLVVYLVAMAVRQKSPYIDRDFLIVFNWMLIFVLSIVTFAISENKQVSNKFITWINFLLLPLALVIDVIALTAIIFRLTAYGFTPNRITVLCVNILVFCNLAGMLVNYTGVLLKKKGPESVMSWINKYLPVYLVWAIIVVFLFPFLFRFK
jgi:hypothetical protein